MKASLISLKKLDCVITTLDEVLTYSEDDFPSLEIKKISMRTPGSLDFNAFSLLHFTAI